MINREAEETGQAISPWHRAVWLLTMQTLLLTCVVVVSFTLNKNNLLGYIDGQYLLVLTKNRLDFTGLEFAFSRNPLQGLGELWYFANTLWCPEFWPALFIKNHNIQVVAIQTFAAIEMFFLISILMMRLGLPIAEAIAAAWAAVIFIAPLSHPSLIYNISPDAPQLISVIGIPIIIYLLWSAIGQGRWFWDIALTAATCVLLWLHFIAVGVFTLLTYPFLVIFCTVDLISSFRRRREFYLKCGLSVALLIALAATGLIQLLPGIVFDTAAYFFPDDLKRSIHELSDGSLLFRWQEPFGIYVVALGLVGAADAVRSGGPRLRVFALATLLLGALIYGASFAWGKLGWAGAIPIYYEYPLWPIYAAFAALLVCRLVAACVSFGSQRSRRPPAGWSWALAPVFAVILIHGGNEGIRGAPNGRINVFPPKPTDLTAFLQSKVAIAPGSPFRGRVATMTGQGPKTASWIDAFNTDLDLLTIFGNEHRNTGLWYYNIPTLFTFSHTLGPLYYAVVKRYLACPGDSQYRTIVNIRCSNNSLLRLLGVSYVVSDGDSPAEDAVRVAAIDKSQHKGLFVDQIVDPNLGFSPTEIVTLTTKGEELDWLGRRGTDVATQAILDGPALALVKASGIAIAIERDGLNVQAQSEGESLVILPFEYSHCWTMTSAPGVSPPTLQRGDLLLVALSFNRKLDVRLKYRLGPLEGMGCKLADFKDHKALLKAVAAYDLHALAGAAQTEAVP